MMPIPKRVRPCRICFSPYRGEIEKAYQNEFPLATIATKYAAILNTPKKTVYDSLQAHFKKEHPKYVPIQATGIRKELNNHVPSIDKAYEKHIEAVEGKITFDIAAENLLKIGMKDIEKLTGKEALYLAAKMQKVHLEGQKVQIQESALKLAAAKFFGGFLTGSETEPKELQGEEVEDELIEIESGNQE